MSILTNVSIPVTSPSLPRTSSRIQQEEVWTRRIYGDGPLLAKPSAHAPRRARIVGRVAEYGVPQYLLQIGDVSVPDVGLDEILEYVSPRELEEFETCQFEEENRILNVAEAAREAEREAAREYAKERAKRKGVVAYEERDDVSSTDETDGGDAPPGRHGRARPSYAHLYEIPQKRRRRRKRDPVTGELLPLSDRETDSATSGASSQDEVPESALSPELPKRRRRRRDKVTGELIPLPPEIQAESKVRLPLDQPHSSSDYVKRPRRRRHPTTRELMPLGWRYDPGAEMEAAEGQDTSADAPLLTSNRGDGMKDGPDIKRLKLAADAVEPSYAGTSLTVQQLQNPDETIPPEDVAQIGMQTPRQMPSSKKDLQHQSSEDSEMDQPEGLLQRFVDQPQAENPRPVIRTTSLVDRSSSNSPSKQLTLAAFLARNSKALQSSSASSVTSKSTDELQTMPKTSILRQPASAMAIDSVTTAQKKTYTSHQKQKQKQKQTKPHKTSIMNPVASEKTLDNVIDLVSDEETLNKDEWFVEAILDHHLSDPRTHPPGLGHRPVMLYRTKWQGFDEPTWEPEESFIEPGVLDEYREKAGLTPSNAHRNHGHLAKTRQGSASGSNIAMGQRTRAGTGSLQSKGNADEEEKAYEIEKILAHHLSDPRTHSKGLGTAPVMLYLVKWVGYEEPTWEPIDSFPDRGIIEEYKALAKNRS